MRLLDGKLWGTKWLIDHLGIDYFGSVVTVDLIPRRARDPLRANDATVALLAQLGRLDSLRLTGTAVTDAGLVHESSLAGACGLLSAGLDGNACRLNCARGRVECRWCGPNGNGWPESRVVVNV
jgi:hypothetical protein